MVKYLMSNNELYRDQLTRDKTKNNVIYFPYRRRPYLLPICATDRMEYYAIVS